ncbi:MAG: endonuclease NucS [Euryarchaeota archaeon]|nr:endonuclease NucS [Euryarchaeota archaeon]
MHFRLSPEPHVAREFLREHHRRSPGSMLLLVGECRVDYQGRARSTLDWGGRLIVLKGDGTLMVHRNTLWEPVNWQPPQARVEFRVEEGELEIYSRRPEPAEELRIRFRTVELLTAHVLHDDAALRMVGYESDLVDHLEGHPEAIEPGLVILGRERETKSGLIDLVARDTRGQTVIIEVKRSPPTPNAAYQLHAYLLDYKKRNAYAPVRGILVAPRIPAMVQTLLQSLGLEFREVQMPETRVDDRQRTLDGL